MPKSLSRAGGKSPPISVRLGPKAKAALDRACRRDQLSQSEAIRAAILHFDSPSTVTDREIRIQVGNELRVMLWVLAATWNVERIEAVRRAVRDAVHLICQEPIGVWVRLGRRDHRGRRFKGRVHGTVDVDEIVVLVTRAGEVSRQRVTKVLSRSTDSTDFECAETTEPARSVTKRASASQSQATTAPAPAPAPAQAPQRVKGRAPPADPGAALRYYADAIERAQTPEEALAALHNAVHALRSLTRDDVLDAVFVRNELMQSARAAGLEPGQITLALSGLDIS